MESPPQQVCSLCKDGGHHLSNCPELSHPLKNGFYSGGGGNTHTHEEEHN